MCPSPRNASKIPGAGIISYSSCIILLRMCLTHNGCAINICIIRLQFPLLPLISHTSVLNILGICIFQNRVLFFFFFLRNVASLGILLTLDSDLLSQFSSHLFSGISLRHTERSLDSLGNYCTLCGELCT